MTSSIPVPTTTDDGPSAGVNIQEHFIPIRKSDLVDCLAEHLSGQRRVRFLELCNILDATFHFEFKRRMEDLKNAYSLLDPDRDTFSVTNQSGVDSSTTLEAAASNFFANTIELLERANFTRLDREHIESAIGAASDWGINLHVDFDLYERLEVYSRGDVVGSRTRRRFRNRYREEQVDVPIYQRLVVVFQLRQGNQLEQAADPNRVYLKLFKNIPKMDLDMLLPGTRVKITRFDQGKIILPTLSGMVLALVKIIKGIALLATATVAGMLSFLGILAGTLGYGIKSFLGYLRTKDKYQLNLTRSLYFQNLDNNAGVLCRLLDEAEEQEFREAILAWFLLWHQAPSWGWTKQELDLAAERYLAKSFSLQVDFEIDDALAKLSRLGLSQCDSEGRWIAESPEDSFQRLDHAWDDIFCLHGGDSKRSVA